MHSVPQAWASLFYIGITIGRFICGFVTMKLNDQNMIRLGQFFIAVGAILMLLPLGDSLLFIGLILIGLGCAPIYPSIIHETPANFGADLSQGIIGIQMAFAYVGTCLMPPVFGVLGQHISFGLYPVFLMAILILMVVMAERMHRVTAEKEILIKPTINPIILQQNGPLGSNSDILRTKKYI